MRLAIKANMKGEYALLQDRLEALGHPRDALAGMGFQRRATALSDAQFWGAVGEGDDGVPEGAVEDILRALLSGGSDGHGVNCADPVPLRRHVAELIMHIASRESSSGLSDSLRVLGSFGNCPRSIMEALRTKTASVSGRSRAEDFETQVQRYGHVETALLVVVRPTPDGGLEERALVW